MAGQEQDNDESLMVRVSRGDHQAFATLVERHSDMFYAAAYRMCGQVQESEDVVQDAFLKLWQKPDSFDPKKGTKFSTWMYRVVTNLAIDHLRKKKGKYDSADALEYLVDEAPAADVRISMDEEQLVLETAIQKLPERQKAALNLCFYEGLSNKEAADILDIGVKALESLLMRAKAGLRENLAAPEYGVNEKEKSSYG